MLIVLCFFIIPNCILQLDFKRIGGFERQNEQKDLFKSYKISIEIEKERRTSKNSRFLQKWANQTSSFSFWLESLNYWINSRLFIITRFSRSRMPKKSSKKHQKVEEETKPYFLLSLLLISCFVLVSSNRRRKQR